jgi:ATP-dependent helicase HrpB
VSWCWRSLAVAGKLPEPMVPLPIDSSLPRVIELLGAHRSLVLVAAPGAGKTTRVPPAILGGGLLDPQHPSLAMLQPRRVAARTVAARIAAENHWTLGREVGYHVRFDRMLGPSTRLRVLTEGILTRQLLADPFLTGIGAVLLDEFHERSLNSDIAIALLREVQQTVRPDLLLVVMSATLEAEPAAEFLGGCPVLRVQGAAHPVEVVYAPPPSQQPLAERVADAVQREIADPQAPPGDVLAFLPGAAEIRRAQRLLESVADRENLLVLPLYGALPPAEQDLALRPAARRKIILATNIAETSLTIDGVRSVIDAGMARVAGYDPQRGLDRLDLQWISKASAAQRAGRAGRTAPGRCIRLWSQKQQHQLQEYDLPEVQRIDLSAAVLSLHAWGKPDVRAFGWYQPPADDALAAAERLLVMLGAIDPEHAGRLTPLGQRLASVPAHPRLARLLLAASDAGMPRQGAALAALLSEKDILLDAASTGGGGARRDRAPTTVAQSDLLHRLTLLDAAEANHFRFTDEIDLAAARQVARLRDQLLRVIGGERTRNRREPDDQSLLRLPLAAYPDRVCKRRQQDPAEGTMVGGGGVRLAPESAVRHGALFLAIDLHHDPRSPTRQASVRIASAIQPEWLEQMFPQSMRRQTVAEYESGRQRVVGVVRSWYLDLLLEERPDAAVEAALAGQVLADALRPRAGEIFAADSAAAQLIARIALLRQHMPEHPWPLLDEPELAELLAGCCAHQRSLAEATGGDALSAAVRGRLPYPLDRLLEQHAPPAMTVPSGSRIPLQYLASQPPVLSVRLQEIFGCRATPTVAAGRVPIKLHLLGPNYRPVQITDDLANFWATTYFQVRKDLRARYPKHAWPDDPLTAAPVAKGRRAGS